jgi:hypothetical protein
MYSTIIRGRVDGFPTYQKVLWLDISVANTNAAMNVSQCPTLCQKPIPNVKKSVYIRVANN